MKRISLTLGRWRQWLTVVVPIAAVAGATANVQACAVCFGDPNSPMVKGVVAGVAVLVGIVSFVLLGVVGTGMYWVHRGKRPAGMEEAANKGSEGKERQDS